jgi:hypothetical protein
VESGAEQEGCLTGKRCRLSPLVRRQRSSAGYWGSRVAQSTRLSGCGRRRRARKDRRAHNRRFGRQNPSHISPPPMHVFRAAHEAKDAKKAIELRNEFGERGIAGKRLRPLTEPCCGPKLTATSIAERSSVASTSPLRAARRSSRTSSPAARWKKVVSAWLLHRSRSELRNRSGVAIYIPSHPRHRPWSRRRWLWSAYPNCGNIPPRRGFDQ